MNEKAMKNCEQFEYGEIDSYLELMGYPFVQVMKNVWQQTCLQIFVECWKNLTIVKNTFFGGFIKYK